MLHLAAKAFWPGKVPFPVLHVDTGHNFPEVIEFRDETVERLGIRLEVASVQDYIDDGRLQERADGTRNPLQTVRCSTRSPPATSSTPSSAAPPRRGQGPRQGAHHLACATSSASGTRATSAPSSGASTTAGTPSGQHVRAFPISNWTELDVWRYIEREGIACSAAVLRARARGLCPRRHVARRRRRLAPARGEAVERRTVRYRTVGDMSCTGAVESDAATSRDVVAEVAPPPSPSAAPPAPTTASPRPPWRTARRTGTSDDAALTAGAPRCSASPPPDRSTTASPPSSAGCCTTRRRSSPTSSSRSPARPPSRGFGGDPARSTSPC